MGPVCYLWSALQKYFLRRHACAYKNTPAVIPARARTHTRPCTQRRPELRRPWQWRGASGPTACCHRAEPANAPKTGDYRRAQLPSYLKSGPSNEPGCAGDTSAGAVRGVVGAVCKRRGRPATGPTYATSPGPRSRTHLSHSAYLHCKSALSSHSLPLLHCVSPINARICSHVRRAISPICAYIYIYIFLCIYIYYRRS